MTLSGEDALVMSTETYSVVLGLSQPPQARSFVTELERRQRLKLLQTVENAVLTVEMAIRFQPNIIILSDLSQGTPGRYVLPDLARLVPDTLVILTVPHIDAASIDPDLVLRVIQDRDVDALHNALDVAVSTLDNPDAPVEARARVDRRVKQDWTKVFAERRQEPRRLEEGAESPE